MVNDDYWHSSWKIRLLGSGMGDASLSTSNSLNIRHTMPVDPALMQTANQKWVSCWSRVGVPHNISVRTWYKYVLRFYASNKEQKQKRGREGHVSWTLHYVVLAVINDLIDCVGYLIVTAIPDVRLVVVILTTTDNSRTYGRGSKATQI